MISELYGEKEPKNRYHFLFHISVLLNHTLENRWYTWQFVANYGNFAPIYLLLGGILKLSRSLHFRFPEEETLK